MAKVCIIHGAYGSPEENWFGWLRSELESEGHTVVIPTFPTPKGQSLGNWLEVFDKSFERDEDTILVGHSVGASFILSILERSDFKVRAAFLVAGFASPLGDPVFDPLNKTFVEKDFDWDKIRSNCRRFFVFQSDDDPYVPQERGEHLARMLGCDLIMVKGAGHFNRNAGYTKF